MSRQDKGLIVFFGCNNLEETDRFYREIMGLSLDKDQGLCRIYNVDGGGRLGFCEHIKIIKAEKSPIITLVADDVDALYKRLLSNNIKAKHPPARNLQFNIYHFFLEDPNGYTLEIQKFL